MDETTPHLNLDEALLSHSAWVRRLARRLVADEDRADDVVQQAWLVALEKKPKDVENPAAWLAKVVRVTASHLKRGDARRREREDRSPRMEPVPTPAELVEQGDLLRRVVEAVARLREPYRTTLLLRFYRDLAPVEIARMLDIPAATVRSRIQRALRQLEETLTREFDGDRDAWRAGLIPLVGLPDVTSSTLASTLGVIAMGTKATWTGITVVAACLFAWWCWPEPPMPRGSDTSPTKTAATSREEERPLRGEEDSGSIATTPTDSTATSASEVVVVGSVAAPDGLPIRDARIELLAKGDTAETHRKLLEVRSGSDGAFRMQTKDTGAELFVVAWADGHWSGVADAVRGEPVALTLAWKTQVYGQVLDADTDEPVAGAEVFVNNQTDVTDASGVYRVGELTEGEAYVRVRKDGYLETSGIVPIAGAETPHDLRIARGDPLVIEIFDERSGEPIAGAEVWPFADRERLAVSDARGRASLPIEDGMTLALRFRAEGYAPLVWHYEVRDAKQPPAPRIPMSRWAWIDGTVSDGDGAGVAAVAIRLRNEAREDGRIDFAPEQMTAVGLPGYAYREPRRGPVETDEQGDFRLAVVPAPTPYHVSATLEGFGPAGSGPLLIEDPDARVALTLTLVPGATILGTVTRNDTPWRGSVRWLGTESASTGHTKTDEQGRYELLDVTAGSVRLSLDPGAADTRPPEPVELWIEPGASARHDFTWREDLAAIRGVVTKASGDPVAGARLVASRMTVDDEYRAVSVEAGADGSYSLPVQPGATYTVSLHETVLQLRHGITAGTDDVDFEVPDIGTIRLKFADSETGAHVRYSPFGGSLSWRPSGTADYQNVLNPGQGESGTTELELPVGPVDLRITIAGYRRTEVRGVEVATGPGPDPTVVELQPGLVALFRLRPTDGSPASGLVGRVLFALEDSEVDLVKGPYERQEPPVNFNTNGTLLWVSYAGLMNAMLDVDASGSARLEGLAPGHYTIRAFPDDVAFEPARFRIDDAPKQTITVGWRAR